MKKMIAASNNLNKLEIAVLEEYIMTVEKVNNHFAHATLYRLHCKLF